MKKSKSFDKKLEKSMNNQLNEIIISNLKKKKKKIEVSPIKSSFNPIISSQNSNTGHSLNISGGKTKYLYNQSHDSQIPKNIQEYLILNLNSSQANFNARFQELIEVFKTTIKEGIEKLASSINESQILKDIKKDLEELKKKKRFSLNSGEQKLNEENSEQSAITFGKKNIENKKDENSNEIEEKEKGNDIKVKNNEEKNDMKKEQNKDKEKNEKNEKKENFGSKENKNEKNSEENE